eukprot:419795_1
MVLKESEVKHKALHKRKIKGANYKWQNVYQIQKGTPITVKHILCVLLYTNHTELSAQFSNSFRKFTAAETDISLKQRHSEYANWAKGLREAIEVWGKDFSETIKTRKHFYHGISQPMRFVEYQSRFCCPTSTTLQYSTAVMFTNQSNKNGIVITIKNNGNTNSFFDCIPWSKFSYESEMLFIA